MNKRNHQPRGVTLHGDIAKRRCAIFVLSFVLANFAHAEAGCSDVLDPTDYAICEQSLLTKKEEALNRSYARILGQLSHTKNIAGRNIQLGNLMIASQSAWAEYRKKTCQLEAAIALLGNPNRGRLAFDEEAICLARMADQRLQQLQEISAGLQKN